MRKIILNDLFTQLYSLRQGMISIYGFNQSNYFYHFGYFMNFLLVIDFHIRSLSNILKMIIFNFSLFIKK